MSIPSLASNLENVSSTFSDAKQLKHLGSSEAFQTFLNNSHYASPAKVTRPLQQRGSYYLRKGDDVGQDSDDMLEYLSPQKRSCIFFEPSSAILPKTKRLEEGESSSSMAFLDLYDIPASSKSIIRETAEECGSESQGTISHSVNKQRKLKASQGYSRGFECPNMENLDEKTRQFIAGLQDRIVKLEGEVVKLKKDNHDLSTQNKKYEDIMVGVVEEQERLAKTRDDYEKKIASLRENCQSNQGIVDSLKDILTMQEGEFFERVVKKEKKQFAKSMSNTRTTRSSTKLSQNQVCSVPSLEAILEANQKENKGTTGRKQLSVKVGTARSVSKNSISSLCTRKASRTDNCFKTTEVPL